MVEIELIRQITLNSIDIVTVLTFQCINMKCLHLLACSSISFSNILQFSMYIYFTSLVRLFLNIFLMLLEIEFLFLIFFLDYSLLVYTVQQIFVCWFVVLKICWTCLLLLTSFFFCMHSSLYFIFNKYSHASQRV